LVLAEASAVGIPAVASDVPALGEVAALTGATVVPVGDVQAISAACDKLGRKGALSPKSVPEFELQNVISQYSSEMTRAVCHR
jgi:glycosyltransferase involved in cell wall biosynthesis